MCLALAQLLPMVTGTVPKIGNMLCPMHIPVLLCGFLCGYKWGLLVGFVAPLMRSFIFSMPPLFPEATSMAFELATYGLVVALVYNALPKKTVNIYVSLAVAMLSGRIVWGVVRLLLLGLADVNFSFQIFVTSGFVTALPGIILQFIIVPLVVMLVKKTKFII